MPRTNTSNRKILDAAAEEFARNGYHLTSMDSIAARAGVAKGTLYYNFPTKVSLFNAVLDDGTGYLMGEVTKAIETAEPVGHQIRRIARLHLELFSSYPQIVRIMFHELSSGLDAEVREHVEAVRERYVAYFGELIGLAAAEGFVQEVDHRALARLLVDLLYSSANYLEDNPSVTSVDQMAALLDTILFDGVFRRSSR